MAGSPLSLESLSSPSPSPSPAPGTNKPSEPNSAGLNSDSELSELTEEEQEADKSHKSPRKSQRNDIARRGSHPLRRGARRKTNSIVPAPMWGWAEAKSSNVLEEEEEEEFKGPPRAMEEEEEDDETRDDEEDELGLGKIPFEAEDDPTDEDDPPALNGIHDDNDDHPFVSRQDSIHHITTYSRRSRGVVLLAASVQSEEDGGVDNKAALSGDDDGVDIELDENDDGFDIEPPRVHSESGDDTESEDEQAAANNVNLHVNHAPTDVMRPHPSPLPMDVDQETTAPPATSASTISPIIGSTKSINPPPLSRSSQSVTSSQSPSPDAASDTEEVLGTHDKSTSQIVASNALHDESGPDVGVLVLSPTTEVDVVEPEAPDEQAQDQDAERPQDQDIDIEEHEDLDLEVESDLQPAYRAEALDVLATIELKFALLRERVYVEKMEGLAWEEALISGEIHPELTNLQNELTNRRDKRLQLASRKRSFEIDNIQKRRRSDEDAIWSWWKTARDELQTDMISETNRKRRRVERDRRAVERPQSFRRIPSLPRDLPPAPSLRKIIKSSYPFDTSSVTPNTTVSRRLSKRHQLRYRHSHAYITHGHQRLIYPELPTLSSIDVANDLDFLFQARLERENGSGIGPRYDMHLHPQHQHHRHSVGVLHHMRIPPPIMAQSHPTRYGVEFKEGFGVMGDPTNFVNNRGQPAPFSQQQQPHPSPQHLILGQTQLTQPPPLQLTGVGLGGSIMTPATTHAPTSFAGPPAPRPQMHLQQQAAQHPVYAQRHEHHTIPQHHHQQHHPIPSSFSNEQEVTGLNGPAHHPYFSSSEGPHLQAHGGQRSISPPPSVSGMPDGTINGSWTMPPKGLVWDEERDEAGRRRGRGQQDRNLEREQRERERENQEMERDRQKEMNVHHMHHTQHRHPQPPHHRLHSAGGQQPLHHHANGPHHHHHRHVHVLHHHHQSQPGTPSGGSSLPSSGAPGSPGGTYRDSETAVRLHPSQNQHPTEIINLTSTKTSPQWKNDGQQRQHSSPPERRDMKSGHGRSQPPSAEFSIAEDRETRPPTIPFALSPSHVLTSSSMSSSTVQHHHPRNSSSTSSHYAGPQPTSNGSLWNDNNAHMPGASVPTSGSLPPGYGSSSEGAHMHLPSHQYAVGASNDSTLHEPPLPPPPPPSSGPMSQHPSRQNSLGLHSPPRPTGLNNSSRLRPVTPPQAESSSTVYRNLSPTRSPSRIAPSPSLSMLSQGSQQPPMTPGTGPAHPSRSPSTSLKAMRPQSPPSSMVNKLLSGPLPPTPLSTGTYSPPRLSRLGRTSTPTGSTVPDGPSTKTSGSGSTSNMSARTSSPLATFSSTHSHTNINGSAFGSGPRLPLTTSASGMNGGNSTTSSGIDRHWERERDSERDWPDREKRERDCHVSSPHLGPPPPKISVPQMVDRH